MIAAGAENNLSKEFITKFLKAIHEESISHQHKIISE
jgi:chorismate mutase